MRFCLTLLVAGVFVGVPGHADAAGEQGGTRALAGVKMTFRPRLARVAPGGRYYRVLLQRGPRDVAAGEVMQRPEKRTAKIRDLRIKRLELPLRRPADGEETTAPVELGTVSFGAGEVHLSTRPSLRDRDGATPAYTVAVGSLWSGDHFAHQLSVPTLPHTVVLLQDRGAGSFAEIRIGPLPWAELADLMVDHRDLLTEPEKRQFGEHMRRVLEADARPEPLLGRHWLFEDAPRGGLAVDQHDLVTLVLGLSEKRVTRLQSSRVTIAPLWK